MATKITQGEAVLFDSVTGQAFGPVWPDYDEAEEFLTWAERSMAVEDLTPAELSKAIAEWRESCVEEAEELGKPALWADAAWAEHNRTLKEQAADALRNHVQALKREQAELEDGRTYRRYAEEGLKRTSRAQRLTPSAAVDAAVSAYVRDNGDCVPVEVVEGIQAEVERILNQPIVETRAEG